MFRERLSQTFPVTLSASILNQSNGMPGNRETQSRLMETRNCVEYFPLYATLFLLYTGGKKTVKREREGDRVSHTAALDRNREDSRGASEKMDRKRF